MAIDDLLKTTYANAQDKSTPTDLSQSYGLGVKLGQSQVQLKQQQDELQLKQEQLQEQYGKNLIEGLNYLGNDKVSPQLRKLAIPHIDKLLVKTGAAPMSEDARDLFTSVPDAFPQFAKLAGMMQQALIKNDPVSYEEASQYAQGMLSSKGMDLQGKYLGIDDFIQKSHGSSAARNVGLKPEENIELKDATALKSSAFKSLGDVNIGGRSGMDLFRESLNRKLQNAPDAEKPNIQKLIDISNGTMPQNLQTLPLLRTFAAESQAVMANASQAQADFKELGSLRPDLRAALADKYSSKINPSQKAMLQQAVKVRDVDMINMDPGARQKMINDARGIAYDVLGKQAVESRVADQAKDQSKRADDVYKDYAPIYSKVENIAGILKQPTATALKQMAGQMQVINEGVQSVMRDADYRVYGAVGGIFDRIKNRADEFATGESVNEKQKLEISQFSKMISKLTDMGLYYRLEPVVTEARSGGVPMSRVLGQGVQDKYRNGEKTYLELKKMKLNSNQIDTIEKWKASADKSGFGREQVIKEAEKQLKRKLNNAERRYILQF